MKIIMTHPHSEVTPMQTCDCHLALDLIIVCVPSLNRVVRQPVHNKTGHRHTPPVYESKKLSVYADCRLITFLKFDEVIVEPCSSSHSRHKSTPSVPSWHFVYRLAPFWQHVTYYAIGLLHPMTSECGHEASTPIMGSRSAFVCTLIEISTLMPLA